MRKGANPITKAALYANFGKILTEESVLITKKVGSAIFNGLDVSFKATDAASDNTEINVIQNYNKL